MTLFLTFFKRGQNSELFQKPNSDWHFKLNGFRNQFFCVIFQATLIDYFPGEKSSKIGNHDYIPMVLISTIRNGCCPTMKIENLS